MATNSTYSTSETLDLATLPLADGRKLALPLLALAEVQQIKNLGKEELGQIEWRGHQLQISSLDTFCGLQAGQLSEHTTVGIFRTRKDSKQPFIALAFCGLAAHRCISANELVSTELPQEGHFKAAAELDGEVYLVPDLPELLYAQS